MTTAPGPLLHALTLFAIGVQPQFIPLWFLIYWLIRVRIRPI